jgi:uncharacterized protein (DUF58 family)
LNFAASNDSPYLDADLLHALGVLVPIRFNPIKVLPGRHPLGHAGDGMRLLRTRPYVPGEDNPRDIDKFSSPDARQVVEWEDEAQASMTALIDVSASMNAQHKAELRNACVLQLLYSLWRAGDRVGVALFDATVRREIRAANLRAQMQQTSAALLRHRGEAATDVSSALTSFVRTDQRRHGNLVFVVSDFLSPTAGTLRPDIEWRNAINELQRNIVPVIVSFEVQRDIAGLIKLWDPERRVARLVRFDRRRVADINREERARTADLVRRFRTAGLDSIVVVRQSEVYPQLAGLARARRLRRS